MLAAKHTFEAIGTSWSIDTDRPLSSQEKQQIAATIEAFDKVYSRFRDDSLVSRVRARASGSFTFPESIGPLYDTYEKLNRLSGGKINPLIGASLEHLGYDSTYSLVADSPQAAPAFETISVTGNQLTTTQPVLLDIGAIGKGYLVDVVAAIVMRAHDNYVVDGSGDIAVHSDTPDVIGLEHPGDPTRVIGAVMLMRGGLCASAINRRAWGKGMHHIIDATTGLPTRGDIVATWVVADGTMLADALTTGLFFVDPLQLQKEFGDFQYVVMKSNGSVKHNLAPETGEIFA